MGIESGKDNGAKRPGVVSGSLKGALFATAIAGGGLAGAHHAVHEGLEEINRRVLTPAAISDLKHETGATDDEVSKLEAHLKELLIQEINRLRSARVTGAKVVAVKAGGLGRGSTGEAAG